MIRSAQPWDEGPISEIYNHYIMNSVITFEESPVNADEMSKRIQDITSVLPWLVYESKGTILGYAYASPWKSRAAYRHSAEVTVYLRKGETSQGLGTILYTELISRLRTLNYHTVIGGIALPNAASVALHKKLGFEKVAHFKEVGYKFHEWIDVAYWQLLL